jgi:branched-chain amino acid transport system permease protein
MAETVKVGARRSFQPSFVDAFLWVIRIAAVVALLLGAVRSLTGNGLVSLSTAQWRDNVVSGLAVGSVYALIALGYTMVYGVLRFINFAHGEVFMSGAMVGYFVAQALSQTFLYQGNMIYLALFIILVSSMAAATVIAVLLERVAYRPLRGKPRLIPFITAIGASFFLQYSFAGLFGVGVKNYPQVKQVSGRVGVSGFHFLLKTQAIVIVAAVVMMIGLYLLVERTRVGKAIRAVAEDQETARLMGINVDRTIVLVFAIGGAMAGIAAFLYSLAFGQAQPFMGFFPGITAFTASVLGGIGNIVGAMMGGLLIGLIESVTPNLVLSGLGIPAAFQLKGMVVFIALVVILIFRPTGILGERVAEERA